MGGKPERRPAFRSRQDKAGGERQDAHTRGPSGVTPAPKSELREYLEAFGLAVILAVAIITFVAQSFLVQGQSMEPTLHDGQRLLVDKLSFRFREPQRGEIVVFKFPADPRRKFIKRVIGLPGDRIDLVDGKVLLNGEPLEEPYTLGPTAGFIRSVTVPEGRYFVLGDNRTNSEDSRYPEVGFVPRDHLVGRALVVYWPLSQLGLVEIPAIFAKGR